MCVCVCVCVCVREREREREREKERERERDRETYCGFVIVYTFIFCVLLHFRQENISNKILVFAEGGQNEIVTLTGVSGVETESPSKRSIVSFSLDIQNRTARRIDLLLDSACCS